MVGGVMGFDHPRNDTFSSRYFPLMHTRRVTQRLELFCDPECPIPIAVGIAYKDFGHTYPLCQLSNRQMVTKPSCASKPHPVSIIPGTAARRMSSGAGTDLYT
jgi:hypothetical protein